MPPERKRLSGNQYRVQRKQRKNEDSQLSGSLQKFLRPSQDSTPAQASVSESDPSTSDAVSDIPLELESTAEDAERTTRPQVINDLSDISSSISSAPKSASPLFEDAAQTTPATADVVNRPTAYLRIIGVSSDGAAACEPNDHVPTIEEEIFGDAREAQTACPEMTRVSPDGRTSSAPNSASPVSEDAAQTTPATADVVNLPTACLRIIGVSSHGSAASEPNEHVPTIEEEIFGDAREAQAACPEMTRVSPDSPTSSALDDSILITKTTAENVQTAETQDTVLFHPNDIHNAVNHSLTNAEKKRFLTETWRPPAKYPKPFSEHVKMGKTEKRYLNFAILDDEEKHWLAYSDAHAGLYCKVCVVMSPDVVGKGAHETPGRFVTTPATNFAKYKDHIKEHAQTDFHKQALQKASDFLRVQNNDSQNIRGRLNVALAREVRENRENLKPIVKTLLFCGQQGMALRGHRDAGNISSTGIQENDGNFRSLLRFRVEAGDTTLASHLNNAAGNAKYISPDIQNDIIACCGSLIQTEIIQRVRSGSGVYSIIFDETTDISKSSQLSLSLRYCEDSEICESFLEFADVMEGIYGGKAKECGDSPDGQRVEPSVTGEVLGEFVVQLLHKHGLDMQRCVAVATDGCSVMTSQVKGAVATILKHTPNAVHTSCLSHKLNLVLSKCSVVPTIRNTVGTIKSVCGFFGSSAKRSFELQRESEFFIKNVCETRWVERSVAIDRFIRIFRDICPALRRITLWHDAETSSKAFQLLRALTANEFIIGLVVAGDISSLFLSPSRELQRETICLSEAEEVIDDLKQCIDERREKSEVHFARLFAEAEQLVKDVDADELQVPRLAARQTSRSNIPAASPEDYFRRSVFVPVLDNLITDLLNRIEVENLAALDVRDLFPVVVRNLDRQAICEKSAGLYDKFPVFKHLGVSLSQLQYEAELWSARCSRMSDEECSEANLRHIFELTSTLEFATLRVVFEVYAAHPASVATAERSFSSLRRLKTWNRSTMLQERLTGLALMYVHREITSALRIDSIIDKFAEKSRRLKLVL